ISSAGVSTTNIDGLTQPLQRVAEIDLGVFVQSDNASQSGLALAVPGTGPAHRMYQRDRGAIGAHEPLSEAAGFLQEQMITVLPGWLLQPPVQVKPWLDLTGGRACPLSP